MSLSLLPLAGEGGLKGRMRALKILNPPHPAWPRCYGQATLSHALALLVLVEGTLDRAN